jgi:hypothetical protein
MIRNAPAIIFFLVSLTILIYITMQEKKVHDSLSCTANYIQHNDNASINLSIGYDFGERKGTINLMGNLQENNGRKYTLNRKIIFNYYKDGNDYYLKTTESIIFPDDRTNTDTLEKGMPSFFTKKDKSMVLKILKNSESNYLFFIDPVPIYICKNTHTSE